MLPLLPGRHTQVFAVPNQDVHDTIERLSVQFPHATITVPVGSLYKKVTIENGMPNVTWDNEPPSPDALRYRLIVLRIPPLPPPQQNNPVLFCARAIETTSHQGG